MADLFLQTRNLIVVEENAQVQITKDIKTLTVRKYLPMHLRDKLLILSSIL